MGKKAKTIDDIKEIALSVEEMKEPELPKGLGWFTKLMNKFGWHRKYEILVFDKTKLRSMAYSIEKFPTTNLNKN